MASFQHFIKFQTINLENIIEELKKLEAQLEGIKIEIKSDIPEQFLTRYLYLDNKAKQELPHAYTQKDFLSLQEFKNKLNNRVPHCKYYYVLAYDSAKKLIGKLNAWVLGSNLYLDLLYVVENYRQKKIGTQLVYNVLLNASKENKLSKIALSTEGRTSGGVKILKKLGTSQMY